MRASNESSSKAALRQSGREGTQETIGKFGAEARSRGRKIVSVHKLGSEKFHHFIP